MATDATTTQTTRPAGLSPVLGERFILAPRHLAMCCLLTTLFLYVSYTPLFHSVTWRHVYQGRQLLQSIQSDHVVLSEQLIQSDDMLPLSDGVPTVNTAWLSQVICGWTEVASGSEFLTILLAVCMLATSILLLAAFAARGGGLAAAVLGLLVVLMMWWGNFGILQPQSFAYICFAAILLVVVKIEQSDLPPRWSWFVLPLLMALWSNLDASFLVGVTAVSLWSIGRAIERRGDRKSMISTILLGELCLLATLLHPLGIDLWAHAARMSGNHFVHDLGGWRPLILVSWAGVLLVASWIAIVLLWQRTKVKVQLSEILLMAASSLAVAVNASMIVWFAPIAVLVMVRHGSRYIPNPKKTKRVTGANAADEAIPAWRFGITMVCVLVVWCGFSLSPAGTAVLGGQGRDASQLHHEQTPRGVAQHLNERPSEHLVFAPAEWGDWLAWSGGGKTKVYANTNFHLLPQQAKYDYRNVTLVRGNWQRILDRYRVGVLVVDKRNHPDLFAAVMKAGEQWTITYEDDMAIVLRRKEA